MANRNTLETLQKKAQELLNMGSISSASSESSASPLEEIRPVLKKDKKVDNSPIRISNPTIFIKPEPPKPKQRNHTSVHAKNDSEKLTKNKVGKANNDKSKVIIKALKETTPTTPIKTGR